MRFSKLNLATLLAVFIFHGCARSEALSCGRSETPSHYVYRATTNNVCFAQPNLARCRPRGDPDTSPNRPRFTIVEGDIANRYGKTLRCYAEQGDQIAIYLVSWENYFLAMGRDSTSPGADDILLDYLPDPNAVDPQAIRRDCMDRRSEAFYSCGHGLPENWRLAYTLVMDNPHASREKLLLMPRVAKLAEAGGFVVPQVQERVAERLARLEQK